MLRACHCKLMVGVLMTLAGCFGYRIGPVGSLPYRSIAVPVLENATLQPQLEAPVTEALRQRFQTDGTLQLTAADTADVLLRGRIIRYEREPIRAAKTDVDVTREYRIAITAAIEVRDRRSGEIILPSREITGVADVFVGTDQQSAEQQAIPLAAAHLAQQVVTLLTERW